MIEMDWLWMGKGKQFRWWLHGLLGLTTAQSFHYVHLPTSCHHYAVVAVHLRCAVVVDIDEHGLVREPEAWESPERPTHS